MCDSCWRLWVLKIDWFGAQCIFRLGRLSVRGATPRRWRQAALRDWGEGMQGRTASGLGDRERVLAEAVLTASKELGITHDELERMLQPQCFAETSSSSDSQCVGDAPQQLDQAALLVMIHRALLSLVGGDGCLARDWMGSPNQAFAGRTPKGVMLASGGVQVVLAYLNFVDSHG